MKKLLSLVLVLVLCLALCVPAAAFSAQLSAQNLSVNGRVVECEKYNIDGSNYFKLRDLAMLLNGTGSQFDVGWDSVNGVVSITRNHAYTTPNGHELETGADNSATAQVSAQTILIDGVLQSDLTVYNIGGSNFFKLRELGDKLGFTVDYDQAANTAVIISAPAEKQDLPGFSDQPTKENVYALLDAYDPDGAYILRQTDSSSGGFGMGMDFTFWLFGSRSVVDNIEVAVHEQCHMLSHSKGWTDDYYVGAERSVSVSYTDYFNSKEMIPLIPDKLKTSRYETYIEDPDAPDASTKGIYGLLNEFMAYSWGLNNTVCLFGYYRDYGGNDAEAWFQYINHGANNRLAYAEFQYYILTYLLYAEANHPEIYEATIANAPLRQAFRELEEKFAANILRFEATLDEITRILGDAGISTKISGDFFYIGSRGTGMFTESYQALMETIAQPEYQRMLEALKA